MKRWIILAGFFIGTTISYGQVKGLSPAQIERVRILKDSIADVDQKSLAKTVAEIEKTNDPEMVLQIQETIAKVYADIVRDQTIGDLQTKVWLYNKVALNMANLQFGGRVGNDPVNQMISSRLKRSLPQGITANPHFHVSVE